jgi:hypothetical protein
MASYLFIHHFPKAFQGSPETAAAATAWFQQLEPNLGGALLPWQSLDSSATRRLIR